MSSLKWDMPQPSKMLITRETMHKTRQYQILRLWIVQKLKFLKSDTPFKFAYILAPEYGTEMF